MINTERLLNEFLELVRIDSESGHEKAMGDRLTEILTGLGIEFTTQPACGEYESDGYNILARLPGTTEGEPILLDAHMDTVVPGRGIAPYVKDGVVYSGENTILGGDDKSGVAAMLEAVRVILEKTLPHREAELLFSIGEETGLYGAQMLDPASVRSRIAFVLDGGGDVGKIEVGAPGQISITANIYGKKSHAGVAPEKGVSAVQAAAKGIAKMNLLRIDEETTCNIGTVRAESPTNIVPDHLFLEAEARSRNAEKLDAQVKHMVSCLREACDECGARLETELETVYAAYNIPADSGVVRMACDAMERVGCGAEIGLSGGGSDANIFNAKGITSVVLSTGMSAVHTTQEYISVKNLEAIAEVVLDLLTH